jgi:hypothetical protein
VAPGTGLWGSKLRLWLDDVEEVAIDGKLTLALLRTATQLGYEYATAIVHWVLNTARSEST